MNLNECNILNMSSALNLALNNELLEDKNVIVIGEDVGKLGGVFRVTNNLIDKYGPTRVIDAPLGEAGIVGTSLGMALNGDRVFAEIQFEGFIYTAFNEIVTQLSRMQDRFRQYIPLHIVIRLPSGSAGGGIEHHQESPESILCSIPNIRVVYVSCSNDAYWLLRESIALGSPVVFLESKQEYWTKGEINYDSPIKKHQEPSVRILFYGQDVSIFAWGPMVRKSSDAARILKEKHGINAEVVDLRYLNPIDWQGLAESITRTKNVVIVQEVSNVASVGSYIAHEIMSRFHEQMENKPVVLGTEHKSLPAGRYMNDFIPSAELIAQTVLSVVNKK